MCSLSDLNNKGGDGEKGESKRKMAGRKQKQTKVGVGEITFIYPHDK